MSSSSGHLVHVLRSYPTQCKQEGRRVAMSKTYDASTARIAHHVVDIFLVGDSVGNVRTRCASSWQ